MRNRSPVENVLLYSSFAAASIALHLLVILGGRGQDQPIAIPGLSGAGAVGSAREAPVAPSAKKTGDASKTPGAPARSAGRPS